MDRIDRIDRIERVERIERIRILFFLFSHNEWVGIDSGPTINWIKLESINMIDRLDKSS